MVVTRELHVNNKLRCRTILKNKKLLALEYYNDTYDQNYQIKQKNSRQTHWFINLSSRS